MIDIQQWLDGPRNFQKGKLLYDKYGDDKLLKKDFQRGKNKVKQKRLELELQKILKRNSLNAKSTQADTRFKEAPKEIPEAIKPLIHERKELFVVARNAHAHLSASKSEQERFELASLILTTWDKIGAIWEKLDYYEKHRKLPEEKKTQSTISIKSDQDDIISLYSRLLTLRTYISRNKKKPDKQATAKQEANMIIARINHLYGYKRLKPLD